MLFSLRNSVVLALLGSQALAANIDQRNYPVKQCSTLSGTKYVKNVPTTTTTVKSTSTRKTTVTPTSTITARGVTVTATSTTTVTTTASTSIAGVTGTVTATATSLETQTAPTSTASVKETSTTVTTVTIEGTIPTAPGFLPAADTIPGDNLSEKKKRGVDTRRRALDPATVEITPVQGGPPLVIFKSPKPEKRTYPQRYPTKVVCTATSTTTVTSTCTARAVTVIKPGVPTTSTRTSTVTAGITLTQNGPSATVTVTVTSVSITTETPSTTVTVTETATSTETTTIATAYAACAVGTSRNIVTTGGNNSPINGVDFPRPALTLQRVGAGSGSQCCSLCLADPTCAGSALLDGDCYKFVAPNVAACSSPSAYSLTIEPQQPGLGDVGFYRVSNGNCGQYNIVNVGTGGGD